MRRARDGIRYSLIFYLPPVHGPDKVVGRWQLQRTCHIIACTTVSSQLAVRLWFGGSAWSCSHHMNRTRSVPMDSITPPTRNAPRDRRSMPNRRPPRGENIANRRRTSHVSLLAYSACMYVFKTRTSEHCVRVDTAAAPTRPGFHRRRRRLAYTRNRARRSQCAGGVGAHRVSTPTFNAPTFSYAAAAPHSNKPTRKRAKTRM